MNTTPDADLRPPASPWADERPGKGNRVPSRQTSALLDAAVPRRGAVVSPRILDLFSGAGGAAMGYHRAGFTVVGVDKVAKVGKHYPFEFHHGDALEYLAAHGHEFDAVHASPPCKDHTRLTNAMSPEYAHGTGWLLAAIRDALIANGVPWVIENVPGAPMRADFKLCGCMFDLPGLRRERWFETSWRGFELRPECFHTGQSVGVSGHGMQGREYRAGIKVSQSDRESAMGIDWMNRDELAQAIPPAYAELVGAALLAHIGECAA